MDNHTDHTEYLTSPILRKRLFWLHKHYRVPGEFEDFLADYQVKILEGKGASQTLDQFTIDHLRSALGRSGQKAGLLTASQINDEIGSSGLVLEEYEFKEIVGKLDGMNRALFILSYKYGLSQEEIAEIFGCSASRICQLMDKVASEIAIGMNA